MNTDSDNGAPPASPEPLAPPPKILDWLPREGMSGSPDIPPPLPFAAEKTVDRPVPPAEPPPATTVVSHKPLIVALLFSVSMLVLAGIAMIWTLHAFSPEDREAGKKAPPSRTAVKKEVPVRPAQTPMPVKRPPIKPSPRIAIPTPSPDKASRLSESPAEPESPEEGPIAIKKLLLCKRVNGYGVFEPFSDHSFPADDLPAILVYAEIDRFKSTVGTNGRYAISLLLDLELVKAADSKQIIWADDPTPVTDECSSRRKDFYFAHFLALPENTKPDDYLLRIKLTDEADGSVAESELPLTLTGTKKKKAR